MAYASCKKCGRSQSHVDDDDEGKEIFSLKLRTKAPLQDDPLAWQVYVDDPQYPAFSALFEQWVCLECLRKTEKKFVYSLPLSDLPLYIQHGLVFDDSYLEVRRRLA